MSDETKSSVIGDYLENNAAYVLDEGQSSLPVRPSKALAVVACMDSRLDIFALLGLGQGEAHVIRNAGGVISEDVLRSLIISQRLLGTREIILIHHTDCGMLKFKNDELGDAIAAEVGYRPLFPFHAFPDLAGSVRESLGRIRNSPYLQHRNVRGFIYHVATGHLEEVV